VREEQVPDLAELQAAGGESGHQARDRGCRAAVVERRPVIGLNEIDADHTLAALVVEVDRLRPVHGTEPSVRH
jgi:hypothetical protein